MSAEKKRQNNFQLRLYLEKDFPGIIQVYKNSITRLGKEYYNQAQIEAWSSFADDLAAFQKWIDDAILILAMNQQGKIIGFSGMDEEGYIASLFVSSKENRKGVGAKLLAYQIARARKKSMQRITAYATQFSKPLFEKFGLKLTEVQNNEFKGVCFTRYFMMLEI